MAARSAEEVAMKILLAIDGSTASDAAVRLVARLPWPPQSTVRVVTVAPDGVELFGTPWMAVAPTNASELLDLVVTEHRHDLERAIAALADTGLKVEGDLVHGRAATEIVTEARNVRADLVVLGSRGRGPFVSSMLGSVSAEVIDHAPCPVLVARRDHLERLVLAEDGSECARSAEDLVARWPIFDGLPVRVVSVAGIVSPWDTGLVPTTPNVAAETYQMLLDEAMRLHHEIADATAARLTESGRPAQPDVRYGTPAAEIVDAAASWNADLVVLGTHGRTGLKRLVLGSVARNVLMHAPCSVLIVREKAAASASTVGAAAGPVLVTAA